MLKRIKIFIFLFGFLWPVGLKSQPNIRGAYLQIKWTTGLKYTADLYLFSNLSSYVYRPYVLLDWGCASPLNFVQANATYNTMITKFSGSCTFPGYGIYVINYTDSFRLNGIKNITNSQSQNIRLTTTLQINPLGGPNTAPLLQNYPIYFGVSGNQAFFNPNFLDPDGDSLSYAMTNCYAANYYLPNGVSLNQNGKLNFSKDSLGLYAFSYKITEWRKDIDNNYQNVGGSQIDFLMDITNTIGINELQSKNSSLTIYPNPVSNTLYISSEQNEFKNSEIEITNTLGQTVLKIEFKNEVDVSKLIKGIYILKISEPNKQFYYSKFVKE